MQTLFCTVAALVQGTGYAGFRQWLTVAMQQHRHNVLLTVRYCTPNQQVQLDPLLPWWGVWGVLLPPGLVLHLRNGRFLVRALLS